MRPEHVRPSLCFLCSLFSFFVPSFRLPNTYVTPHVLCSLSSFLHFFASSAEHVRRRCARCVQSSKSRARPHRDPKQACLARALARRLARAHWLTIPMICARSARTRRMNEWAPGGEHKRKSSHAPRARVRYAGSRGATKCSACPGSGDQSGGGAALFAGLGYAACVPRRATSPRRDARDGYSCRAEGRQPVDPSDGRRMRTNATRHRQVRAVRFERDVRARPERRRLLGPRRVRRRRVRLRAALGRPRLLRGGRWGRARFRLTSETGHCRARMMTEPRTRPNAHDAPFESSPWWSGGGLVQVLNDCR